METGLRKEANSTVLIPAHFIKEVTASVNGKAVLLAQWGGGISKNPFMGFKVKGVKPGDFIAINTLDTLGVKLEHNVIIV
jgi:sulfur-oxidizing protein SoxZ